MHEPEALPTAHRERLSRPARVLDLPPVDLALRELLNERIIDFGLGHAGLGEERAPDLLLRVHGELGEVQGDVNTREEGLVERGDAVRGEEEDAPVELDVAQAM